MNLERRKQIFIKHITINENGCWIWDRPIPTGYGVTSLNGEQMPAHRASYKLFVGEIPEGYDIHHEVCGKKECVNPEHLKPMSKKEHRRITFSRKTNGIHPNSLKKQCPQGHEYTIKTEYGKEHRICKTCRGEKTDLTKKLFSTSNKHLQDFLNIENYTPKNISMNDLFEEGEKKFNKKVFLSAVRLVLLANGINVFSPKIKQATKFLIYGMKLKHVSLDAMADHYKLEVKRSRLRAPVDDGVFSP